MLTLVTGGARSGKSAAAERLVAASGAPVTYVATATSLGPDGSTDREMVERIERHRGVRPATWTTVEAPVELESSIAAVDPGAAVLVDCLTVWLGNVMFAGDPDDPTLRARFEALAEAAAARTGDTVIVTNEVGAGLVPMDALSRRYRDLHGWMNQAVSARADRAVLCVAGRVLDLADLDSLGPDPVS